MSAIPSIACIGIIGKNNNPLHISIFPSYTPGTSSSPPQQAPIRTPLQFSLLLASALDIFESRSKPNSSSGGNLSGDFGLLHAIDERLAAYGFETNTGVRFVVIVDMRGRFINEMASPAGKGPGQLGSAGLGLRDGEMKPVFKAIQAAYIRLLQNPFYEPDEYTPTTGRGGKTITSKRFSADMKRIGDAWAPGVVSF